MMNCPADLPPEPRGTGSAPALAEAALLWDWPNSLREGFTPGPQELPTGDVLFIPPTPLRPNSDASADAYEVALSWAGFVKTLRAESVSQAAVVDEACRLVRRIVGINRYPTTSPTGGGNVQMAWANGSHYFDLEALPDGRIEWFYRNRANNQEMAGSDEPLTLDEFCRLPAKMMGALRLVRR